MINKTWILLSAAVILGVASATSLKENIDDYDTYDYGNNYEDNKSTVEPDYEENKAIFQETRDILNNDDIEDEKIRAIEDNAQLMSEMKEFQKQLDEEPDYIDDHDYGNWADSDEEIDEPNEEKQDNNDKSLQRAEAIFEPNTDDVKQEVDEEIQTPEAQAVDDGKETKTNESTEDADYENDSDEDVEGIVDDKKPEAETVHEGDDFDDDTVAEVVVDLKDDFKQLFETMDKLARNDDDTEDTEQKEEPTDSAEKTDEVNVLGYEETYGKPYGEDNILSMRDDYENIGDSNLGAIFSDNIEDDSNYPDEPLKDTDLFSEEKIEEQKSTEKIKNIDETSLVESEEAEGASVNEDMNNVSDPTLQELDTDMFRMNDAISKEIEPLTDENKEENVNKLTELPINTDSEATSETTEIDNIQTTVKSIDTSELTAAQYNDIMAQFAEVHKNELDTQSEDFSTHVAPIHMSLSVDKEVEITSPNYPNNYPTNNVVDWIFDGEGLGIEFNITDFAVNGVLGDYLLVKPGGADETGHKGLIFSYQLKEGRNYRFLDVDRMFVRFESKPGLGFNRGFKFSVKMIAPIPEEPEPEPIPEPLIPPPPSTLTVSVGGITASQFLSIREEFRQLVADMATMFINANLVDPGINSTSDVAQITRVSVCNINWPNFENCTEVTFGVPVVYEDEESSRLNEDDLTIMWYTYIYQDPFALRLRRLGITEFSVPNDKQTLMVWLILGIGILISAAMLAFALWRYSCFQSYTRMSVYSDTDSVVNAKRGLDLYPTPHQTLPPLYSDLDLKWDDAKYDNPARVDMSGYTNSNYVRGDLYDFESDEDVISPRDRNSGVGFSPRDLYKV